MMINKQTFKRIEQSGENLFQALWDKAEYVSEPGLQLMQDSLKEPVNKVLHPVDTGTDIAKTVWTTIQRSTEVLSDGFDYIVSTSFSNKEETGDVNEESELEQRQQRAYTSVINNAVDRAVKRSKSLRRAGPNNHDDLEKLSQVGPSVIRQLHAAGIYKFNQIANPTAREKKALQAFESRGAFTVWKEESEQLMATS